MKKNSVGPFVSKDLKELHRYQNRWAIAKSVKKSHRPETSIRNILKFYLRNCTVHGACYLVDEKWSIITRIIWAALIVAGLGGIYYTCHTLQHSYETNVIKNIMETGVLESENLPFPAVVVCNNRFLNWDRVDEAADRFLPKNSTSELRQLFRAFLSGFEVDYLVDMKSALRFSKLQMEQLDLLNVEAVLEFLSFEVDEVIVRCRWRNVDMNCSDLFLKQKTQMGFCFMFNTVIQKKYMDNMMRIAPGVIYPWVSSASGVRSGLRIELQPHSPKSVPEYANKYDSFFVRVLDNDDWPAKRGDYIKPNTLNYFIIDLALIEGEKQIKELPLHFRNCIFNDEVMKDDNYLDFDAQYSICRINCRIVQMLKYCGCVPDYLLPRTRYKACTASGYWCIARNHAQISNYSFSVHGKRADMEEGRCNCYTSCTIVLIDTDVVSRRNQLSNKTVIDFHYRKDAFPKFVSLLSFSWVDYMVYFGGISSTFVGTSIMSIWEILFFVYMAVSVAVHRIYLRFKLQ